jgi:hypothetical protein
MSRPSQPSASSSLTIERVDALIPKLQRVCHTIFEAASMSKPVLAYAVMKLAEQGVIDLDEPPWSSCPTATTAGH